MTLGFGGFRAIGKDDKEINMSLIHPKDVRNIERLEVTN
jgi:hypothetical protein